MLAGGETGILKIFPTCQTASFPNPVARDSWPAINAPSQTQFWHAQSSPSGHSSGSNGVA